MRTCPKDFFVRIVWLLALLACGFSPAQGEEPASRLPPWGMRSYRQLQPIAEVDEETRDVLQKCNLGGDQLFQPVARENIERAIQITNTKLNDSHPTVRNLRLQRTWLDWYVKLPDAERSRYEDVCRGAKRGLALLRQRKNEAALKDLEAAYVTIAAMNAPMHPSYLRLQKGRADALALLGAADESRKVALDLYRIAEVYYGDVSSPMRGALITLAFADSYLGDYVEATRALCRAGQICECIREPIDEAYLYLADAFLVLRACERADACLDLVHARFADSKEPNQFMSVRMLALECRSILEQGQPDQALKMAEEYASALGNQASYLMGFNVTEALARIELGQLEDAERVLKSTQEISAVEGNAFPFQPRHQEAYALLLWKKGKYDDAAAMCEQALEMSRQQYGTDHPLQVRTLRVYADALRESGHKEESDRALARCRAIEQRIEKMRQTILDDPECELPVVNVESNVELPTN